MDAYTTIWRCSARWSARPVRSLLTDRRRLTGGSNSSGDPLFVNPYFNGPRDNLNIPEFTTLQTAGAFDEGGNFLQVTFGPLTLDVLRLPHPARLGGHRWRRS